MTAHAGAVRHYTGLIIDQAAVGRLADVQAPLDQTTYAWYGPTTKGSAAYFRVIGPTLAIEYAPQSGGRGGGAASIDHIHGIYRDPTNDYGAQITQ